MGKQSKKIKVIGHITLAEPSTVREYVLREKDYLYSAIEAGYAEAERRQTSHLDSDTLDALYVEERIDRWAELSSDELYDWAESADNSYAETVLYALARIKAQQERTAREAKALARARARARRERERQKPLTQCPFAAALGR